VPRCSTPRRTPTDRRRHSRLRTSRRPRNRLMSRRTRADRRPA
jgi:hypothetical protein